MCELRETHTVHLNLHHGCSHPGQKCHPGFLFVRWRKLRGWECKEDTELSVVPQTAPRGLLSCLGESENWLWSGFKNKPFCKWVKAYGWLWSYFQDWKVEEAPSFPSAKADTMPNSFNAGGFLLGSCAFITTSGRRNYWTEPLSHCFSSEKIDIWT